MQTFSEYISKRYLDEGFFDSAKQSYQQSYQQAQQNDGQNLEKFANIAMPAIQKATNLARSLSQKTGVPLPLATALVASGIVGGPATVPFAALMYFIKKPLMKGASKAFDAGVQGVQKGIQGVQNTFSQPQQSQQMQPATEGFKNWMYEEGFGDWAGQKVGSMAGTAAGKTVGAANKVSNLIKQSWPAIKQYASENKLAIGKTAFLMGVGALVGGGVGKLTHDAIDSVIQSIGDVGVPPQELAWLRNNFKMELSQGEDGTAVSGDDLYNTSGNMNNFDTGADGSGDTYVNAQDFSHDETEIGPIVNKAMNSLGKSVRVTPVGSSETTGVLSYTLEVTPQPGMSSQQLLQQAYRKLATQLNQQGIKVSDLKSIDQDPSGAIKAMLSVAPNTTAAGAIGGAAQQPQNTQNS